MGNFNDQLWGISLIAITGLHCGDNQGLNAWVVYRAVAGVSAPAFIAGPDLSAGNTAICTPLPGFRLRPSLRVQNPSGDWAPTVTRCRGFGSGLHCGTYSVDMGPPSCLSRCRGFGSGLHCGWFRLSEGVAYEVPLPGFRLRPSLRAGPVRADPGARKPLPGFRLRPSLRDRRGRVPHEPMTAVAGVSAPAFIAGTT